MFCRKCGAQLPDDAAFCTKCGTSTTSTGQTVATQSSQAPVLAPPTATSLKCPSCGASIAPKFGEMIITCEYCGSSITLGGSGWANIQKQTMLPLKIQTNDDINSRVRSMMDQGLLHRHLQESSTLEEMTLSVVPYWLVNASARTSLVATDMVTEGATVATTAALIGVMAGMGGGRRGGGFGGPLLTGAVLGGMMGGGMGGGGPRKAIQMDDNYNFPVIALKALTQYQPKDYQFALEQRTLFDISQYPKGIKVLNGDISEESAKYQAKTLVDQLQSQKAHAKYHMIQQIQSEVEVSDTELLHVPIWFARYDHKGNKIVLVVDGNSGSAINSIGL
ncbi:MAG TPA: zinc-ribbon domain-containing protein [Candidatus Bathyarchaeia archaeon]|nr:zinc-ribbon domain-containing protein [Candidatus Bathyarchaeia archaeon]